jgi:hypothetical protein
MECVLLRGWWVFLLNVAQMDNGASTGPRESSSIVYTQTRKTKGGIYLRRYRIIPEKKR